MELELVYYDSSGPRNLVYNKYKIIYPTKIY